MSGDAASRVVKLAALAVGGQGGGVLTNWIVAVAEAAGWQAQSTSVAGVAQRTGATIYYVEMTPDQNRPPIFALSPAPGDVDILIAAELMEAGRAMMRGFVTPDRTTLIASTHRILSVAEKIDPGDGLRDPQTVHETAERSSARYVAFDMERLAKAHGSVVSACLLGALAGSRALPFERGAYEDAIRASGRGVEASLRAFAAAYERALDAPSAPAEQEDAAPAPSAAPRGPKRLLAKWAPLAARRDAYPAAIRDTATAGLRKTIEFLDVAYGAEYLDRLDRVIALDGPERGWRLSAAAAKHLANAMSYDDPIRVADIKTRARRMREVHDEARAPDGAILHVTEYLHPRLAEVCDCLPAGLARWIERRPRFYRWLDRRVDKGRRIRTDAIIGYSMLWLAAALRPYRRRLKRHQSETDGLETWLDRALRTAPRNYDLAVEILNARRLIKGYSDTHARGTSKFDQVMRGLDLVERRDDAAEWMRRLIAAALADPDGAALAGALQTIESFTVEMRETA